MKIRKAIHPLFRKAPYYVDYGRGAYGMFQVPTQAMIAIQFEKKVRKKMEEADSEVEEFAR